MSKNVPRSLRLSDRMQRVAADILTEFMFCRNMDDVYNTWERVYKRYELNDDPFTGCPLGRKDYLSSKFEFEKQSQSCEYWLY